MCQEEASYEQIKKLLLNEKTDVDPDDILSNKLYFYDRERRFLSFAKIDKNH